LALELSEGEFVHQSIIIHKREERRAMMLLSKKSSTIDERGGCIRLERITSSEETARWKERWVGLKEQQPPVECAKPNFLTEPQLGLKYRLLSNEEDRQVSNEKGRG
jgi:hypothetical protein